MRWKLSGSILVGAAASLAVLHGCSSDDESNGNGNTGGGAGLGGAGDGGSATGAASSTGGANGTGGAELGGGGMGGGKTPEPVLICEVLEQGLGGAIEPRCEVFPEACGDVEDYEDGAVFGTASYDVMQEKGDAPHQVIFALGSTDDVGGYTGGACLVGGEGADQIYFSGSEPMPSPRSNVGIGGPGTDYFFINSANPSYPPIIADIESDETIRFGFINEGAAGDTFAEVIEGFDGTTDAFPDATTFVIYDPTSGKIWADRDGNAGEYAPEHVGTVANADEVTLTVDNFRGP